MTNDFDDLVSAYIDGQATPEEVALVEGDPELRSRAETLRAMAAGLADTPPAPAALRTRHLGAALDAFDELSTTTSEAGTDTRGLTEAGRSAPVVDLAGRRRRASSRAAQVEHSGRRTGLPNWLGAAAALLLVFGGLGWIISQSGGDDDFDTAATEIGESEDQADSVAANDAAADESTTEAAESATTAAAQTEFAADDEATEESERAADTDDDADGTPALAAPTSTTSGGFFSDEEIEEARAFYASVPSGPDLDELVAGELFAPELSVCAGVLDLGDNLELVGFAPISIGGEVAEVLVLFNSGDGSEMVIVIDDTCTPLG